jgi:hypothetical protein
MGRRPIPKDQKKLPTEYPQFTFRVSKAKKVELTELVEAIQATRNKKRKEGDAFVNKNDVIIEALENGLRVMKRGG